MSKTKPGRVPPKVVAAVYCQADLVKLRSLKPGMVDILELRADAFFNTFSDSTGKARQKVSHSGIPWLLTVRDPAEGGSNSLRAAQRKALMLDLMEGASFIDIELRNARAFSGVIQHARNSGIKVVLSHHDFKSTPAIPRLRQLAHNASALGADIFKAAVRTDKPSQLTRLLALMSDSPTQRIAAMGMGALGKASRILLACAGSELNYGYLSAPNAPGQWFAPDLKRRISEAMAV